MNEITLAELEKFILSELWPLKKNVTEVTSLNYDFIISGLDGFEFMEKYAIKFDVDIHEFDWIEFFGEEASAAPFSLASYLFKRFILRKSEQQMLGLPKLTLGHLVKCANDGKWTHPSMYV